jgi:hypothetical protein
MTDFRALLSALTAAGVEFLIVGGAAATAHGSARLTQDLDIVYRRTPGNIKNLVAALERLKPYLRGAPPGLPFRCDEQTISRGLNFTLSTAAGDLDMLGEITGGGNYDDLLPHTIVLQPFGIECRCLTLSRLLDSGKTCAGTAEGPGCHRRAGSNQ